MKYTAYLFQVIEYPTGIILRRGSTQILLEGDDAIPTILIILKSTSGAQATKKEIIDLFPPFRNQEVESLLDELIKKRFLVDTETIVNSSILEETNSDVFYWQLLKEPSQIRKIFKDKKIFIIGLNKLGHLLKNSFDDIGFKQIEHISYGPLNAFSHVNQELSNKILSFEKWKENHKISNNDIVVGASEFGGQVLLLELNEYCVHHNIHFIPVIIDNMKAKVGPLVIPHQTPCLQCLRSRQNAHLHSINLERYAEQYGNEGQEVAATHISILKSAAEVTAFELVRAYGNFVPNYKVTLIEIDLLKAKMSSHTVLKVPRCSACSLLISSPAIFSDKPNP